MKYLVVKNDCSEMSGLIPNPKRKAIEIEVDDDELELGGGVDGRSKTDLIMRMMNLDMVSKVKSISKKRRLKSDSSQQKRPINEIMAYFGPQKSHGSSTEGSV